MGISTSTKTSRKSHPIGIGILLYHMMILPTSVNEFDYEGWWGYKGLPVFKEANGNLSSGAKEHIFDITKRVDGSNGDGDPSDGVDGWRLDVASEIGKVFWKEWHNYVRSINPEAFTVAEIWDEKV